MKIRLLPKIEGMLAHAADKLRWKNGRFESQKQHPGGISGRRQLQLDVAEMWAARDGCWKSESQSRV